ncbi:MAG: polysaccharide biosynthesis protein [Clostridia bacterium]|nr:polysaccharide biosynthesis protein [Clostridia bacterium]
MSNKIPSKATLKRAAFLAADVVSVIIALIGSVLIITDLKIGGSAFSKFFPGAFASLIFDIIFTVAIFCLFRLYSSVWHFASVVEMVNILVSCGAVTLLSLLLDVFLDAIGGERRHVINVGYYFVFFFLLAACVAATRFFFRAVKALQSALGSKSDKGARVMIVGAGSACALAMAELRNSGMIKNQRVVCLIDDNPEKHSKRMNGVPVVGSRLDIPDAVIKYGITNILIAIPSAPKPEIQKICQICSKTKCKLHILPGLYQFINGELQVGKMRDVDINDLLGRDPIVTDIKSIMDYVGNRTVMVTGGGGSIGSELCRQLAERNPKQLIIVDIYENNAYDIQQELRRKFPHLNLEVLIASVRNQLRIEAIFEHYRPDIVYHAAAHKHVPLMEDSPNEAVKNNVFGTLNVVRAADKYGVKRFVMISTDKAVNPTNVMGATKRICEMIIQTYNKRSETEFVAVRFGNVLGSNGSVIPLFKRQIAAGGPVTVTHPDIIRYFMTIPEAVSLVLQAGAYAKGGEIFVLDMGEPVRIADLATNLIRLSGYTPGEDIQVVYTGLRDGEKLYEELLMDEEGLQDTENKLIHIGKPIRIDEEKFLSDLERLGELAQSEPENVRRLISDMVPTYKGDIDKTNLGAGGKVTL